MSNALERVEGVSPTHSTGKADTLVVKLHPQKGEILELERVKGIEPSRPAWKAGTLPLSYTRLRLKAMAGRPTNVRRKLFAIVRWLAIRSSKSEGWWTGQDLNLRTLARTDLQSVAIDHSATCP